MLAAKAQSSRQSGSLKLEFETERLKMFVEDVELTPYCSIQETSNGSKVLCRRIPALLLQSFQEAHPEPKPPMKMVSVLGGKKVEEEDPDDPGYLAELEIAKSQMATDFLYLAIDFMVLLDENQEQAAERKRLLGRWGIPNVESHRVQAFALEDPEPDVELLSQELMRLSTVTASEVATHEENFRPDVGRDAGDEAGDAGQPDAVREGDEPAVS